MSYSDLLRDPRWQRKRLEVMSAADFACQECGDKTTTLHVHHPKYVKGRKPWEYDASELQCLCESCHKRRHGRGGAQRAPLEKVFTLVGGPCDGRTIKSAYSLPLVWVYDKGGDIITAEDFQKTLILSEREAASHFFGRGHPYMYSTMYGPELHAQFQELWRTEPSPVLTGIYGLVWPGMWVSMWGPEANGGQIRFSDPDALMLHMDALFTLIGDDFDEAAYYAEE